jgi:hypothetical protein|tara:strand:- start:1075 stop:1272 length:198 start_codon:yes stop_codon:yes gene_type:complete
VQNKYLGIFIVFFFSGTLSSLTFRLLDNSVFRNAEFKIQDWIYGNLLILLISVLVTYIWVIKNKT